MIGSGCDERRSFEPPTTLLGKLRNLSFLRSWPAILLALIVLMAIFGGLLAPYDPSHQDLANPLAPPSWDHIMGTDSLGRDVFSRLLVGSRVSLAVGTSAVVLAMVIGVFLGVSSAMIGGATGDIIMRLTDLSLTLPGILIALAVAATVGPSLVNVILIIGLLYWAQFARMVRGEALSIRERDYVQAAYSLGCSPARVLFRHILPNLANTIIVLATLEIAAAILLESTLSFLGVGVPPPHAHLGQHDLRGAALCRTGLVGRHVPRPRAHADGPCRQSSGRQAARLSRSEILPPGVTASSVAPLEDRLPAGRPTLSL